MRQQFYPPQDLAVILAEIARREAEQKAAAAVVPGNDNGIPFCPHTPTPKQAEFLAIDDTFEVFFGGATRGGKTDGALMCLLKYVYVPGYAALVLRRTFKRLAMPDAIMARMMSWLRPHFGRRGSAVHWDHENHTLTFACPGGGFSTITFGYLEHENDKHNYDSTQFQTIVFEELTEFVKSQYLYLFTRMSRPEEGPASKLPMRMRATGMPGNIGHQWVKERFVDPDTREPDAAFVPAKLEDNPHTSQEVYERSMSKVDPFTKMRLRYGVWDNIEPGDFFHTDRITLVDKAPSNIISWVRYWDFAGSEQPDPLTKARRGKDPDATSSCWMGLAADKSVWILDSTENRWHVDVLPTQLKLQADADGRATAIRFEEEGGASGKYVTNDLKKQLRGFKAEGIRSTKNKMIRARPLASAIHNNRVYAVRGPRINNLLDRMQQYPYVAFDDVIDSASGAFNSLEETVVATGKLYTNPNPGNSFSGSLFDDNPSPRDRVRVVRNSTDKWG